MRRIVGLGRKPAASVAKPDTSKAEKSSANPEETTKPTRPSSSGLRRPGFAPPTERAGVTVGGSSSGTAARPSVDEKSTGSSSSANKVVLNGQGLLLAAPSSPQLFTVDLTQLKKRYTTNDIKVNITGPCKPSKVEVLDLKDGTFSVSYVLAMSGKYKIEVIVGSTCVGTYQVPCNQPYTDVSKTGVLGQMPPAFLGERFELVIQACDQFGAQQKHGGDSFTAIVYDGDTRLFDADVEDNNDGSYTVGFLPEVAGAYRLAVTLDGRHVSASPMAVLVRADETVAANCKAMGAGLRTGRAGLKQELTVQAVDGKNNARHVGGDPFQVVVTCNGEAPYSGRGLVQDAMNGSYKVEWSSPRAGVNHINITLHGEHIHGSPFAATVTPGPLDASQCEVWGAGLKNAIAGLPATVTVRARDEHGNLRNEGEDTSNLKMTVAPAGRARVDAGGIEGRVEALANAEYKVTYSVQLAGEYSVGVYAGGEAVRGTPCACLAQAGEVDVLASRLYGPGLERVHLGRPSLIMVELSDAFGNRVEGTPDGEMFDVAVQGPDGAVPVLPAQSEPGVLAVSYTARGAGSYTITAKYNHLHLNRSPCTIVASTAEACSGLCEVMLEGERTPAEGASLTAGECKKFHIHARDAAGALKSIGGDIFVLTAKGPGGAEVGGRVSDNQNGTYTAALTCTRAGMYAIHLTLNGSPLSGTPFTANVQPARVCASNTCLAGDAGLSMEAGDWSSQMIQPCDAFHNPIHLSDFDAFEMEVSGPGEVEVKVLSPRGEIKMRTTHAGSFTVACKYNGETLKGSPFKMNVLARTASAKACRLIQSPLAQVPASSSALVVVEALDCFGNASARGNSIHLLVDHAHAALPTIQAHPSKEGFYEATIDMPSRAGLLTLAVIVNGATLPCTPTTIQVMPGRAVAVELEDGSKALTAVAGMETLVSMRTLDSGGNCAVSGGAELIVTLEEASSKSSSLAAASPSGGRAQAVRVLDTGDGFYTLALAPRHVGEFSLHVQLAGAQRTFTGRCIGGELDASRCVVTPAQDNAVAGRATTIGVSCADAHGNVLLAGGGGDFNLRAVASGPGPMSTRLVQGAGGAVQVECLATKAGLYSVAITCARSGAPLPGTPVQVEVDSEGVPDAAACTATLLSPAGNANFVAGKPLEVRVMAVDRYRNPLKATSPSDTSTWQVAVSATGPGELAIQSVPGGDPLALTGKPLVAGSYLVHLSVQGRGPGGWPKLALVAPAQACALRTQVSGAGGSRTLTVGQPKTFAVTTADEFGNVCTSGGDTVEATLLGPPVGSKSAVLEKCSVTDHQNGSYSVQLLAHHAGKWTLQVTVNGETVREGGLEVEAAYGPLAAADCVVSRTVASAVCGETSTVWVHAGTGAERRPISSKNRLAMLVQPPRGPAFKGAMAVREGGEYAEGSVHWTAQGPHQVQVLLDGVAVAGSPFLVQVAAAAPEAAHCFLASPKTRLRCDVAETLELLVRDGWGNEAVLEPGAVSSRCTPPAAARVLGVEPAGPSTLRISLVPLQACSAALEVCVNGQPIQGGSLALEILPGMVSLKMSQLSGEGLTHCTAGEPASFVLQACDASGNRLTDGGLKLTVAIGSPGGGLARSPGGIPPADSAPAGAPARVTDRGDGSYEITYTREVAGEVLLTVALPAGAVSGGKERSITIQPTCRASATQVASSLVQTHSECLRAGEPGFLRISRRDAFGNERRSHDVRFKAHATGPGPMTTEVVEREGGAVEIVMEARVAGAYSVAVTGAANNLACRGSPFSVRVEAGAVEGGRCLVQMQGGDSVRAGSQANLLVHLLDKFGNRSARPADAALLQGRAVGPDCEVKMVPAKDNPELLSAVLTRAGMYTLQASVSGSVSSGVRSAEDGEFKVEVTPGPAVPQATLLHKVPDRLKSGAAHEMHIVLHDAHGNPGATGTVVVETEGEGEAPVAAPLCVDNHRHLKATIQVWKAGFVMVRAWVLSDPSAPRPAPLLQSKVEVLEGETSYLESRVAGFTPQAGAVVGQAAGFCIEARDASGNRRRGGGEMFELHLKGRASAGAAVEVSVQDMGDGSYVYSYVPTHAGTLTLTAKHKGEHLKGSPASISVYQNIKAMAEEEMEKRLAATVSSLRAGVSEARQLHRSLIAESHSLREFIPVMVESTRTGVERAMAQQGVLLDESRASFQREAIERKRLHNLVQELKGNIRVFCRIKPLTEEERAAGQQMSMRLPPGDRSITLGQHTFEFDRAFGPPANQAEVFEDIGGLVTSVLDGYNVCIFAYGQTGAGKTHTMEGPPNDPGINFRALGALFSCISGERAYDYTYTVKASIFEVYNEQVYDLLATNDQGEGRSEGLELVRKGEGFAASGASEVAVASPEEVMEVMAAGFLNRAVGVHDINAHSSRSHCMLVVYVDGINSSSGLRMQGKLTLCDLAGSERISKTGATGLTLTEAQNINNSLLSLGNVISALVTGGAHVPYRNSKLTMLLQDSLGGDAKALMVCNLAPSQIHASETLSSLQFAQKVSSVELRTPRRNLEDTETEKRKPKPKASAQPRYLGGSGTGK